jgi:hypothetical protein
LATIFFEVRKKPSNGKNSSVMLYAGGIFIIATTATSLSVGAGSNFLILQILGLIGIVSLAVPVANKTIIFSALFGAALATYGYEIAGSSKGALLQTVTPFVHYHFLAVGGVLFFLGGVLENKCISRPLITLSVICAVAGAMPSLTKPKSILLERSDVNVDDDGVISTTRPWFLVEGVDSEVNVAVPGAAGTPWFTRHGGILEGSTLQPDLVLVGVLPKNSEFLPIANEKRRMPTWTYLGGGKSALSPLDPVQTFILNHGFY